MARVCQPPATAPSTLTLASVSTASKLSWKHHCISACPPETLRRNTSPPQGKAGIYQASDSQPVPSSQDMLGSCVGTSM